MRGLVLSALSGIAALVALYFLAPYTGVALGITRLSLGVSALLGLPGVTLLVLIEML